MDSREPQYMDEEKALKSPIAVLNNWGREFFYLFNYPLRFQIQILLLFSHVIKKEKRRL